MCHPTFAFLGIYDQMLIIFKIRDYSHEKNKSWSDIFKKWDAFCRKSLRKLKSGDTSIIHPGKFVRKPRPNEIIFTKKYGLITFGHDFRTNVPGWIIGVSPDFCFLRDLRPNAHHFLEIRNSIDKKIKVDLIFSRNDTHLVANP